MLHLGLPLAVLGVRSEFRRKVGDVAQVRAAVRTFVDKTGDIVVGE